jgi:hypothetical protein
VAAAGRHPQPEEAGLAAGQRAGDHQLRLLCRPRVHLRLAFAQRGLLAAQRRLAAGQFGLLAGQAVHVAGAAGLCGLAAGFLHRATCLGGRLTGGFTRNCGVAGRPACRLRGFGGGFAIDVVRAHRTARSLDRHQRDTARLLTLQPAHLAHLLAECALLATKRALLAAQCALLLPQVGRPRVGTLQRLDQHRVTHDVALTALAEPQRRSLSELLAGQRHVVDAAVGEG